MLKLSYQGIHQHNTFSYSVSLRSIRSGRGTQQGYRRANNMSNMSITLLTRHYPQLMTCIRHAGIR